jgi:hypothetical protein
MKPAPKIETPWIVIARKARLIGLIALAIVVVVVVVGLFLGWRTPRDFGMGLLLGGVVAWMLGGGSLLGTYQVTTSLRYQLARSVSPDDAGTRLRQDFRDREAGVSFLLLMFASGLVAVALGILLMAISPPVAPTP